MQPGKEVRGARREQRVALESRSSSVDFGREKMVINYWGRHE